MDNKRRKELKAKGWKFGGAKDFLGLTDEEVEYIELKIILSEMEQLGWIDSKRPRMVTVQSEGCAPMVRAFKEGNEFAEYWQGAQTIADGLRVPGAVGDFLILRALRESQGAAIAVSDEEMMNDSDLIGRTQGIFTAPEGGATLTAFKKLREQQWIKDNETVVLFNTGSGHKYQHLWLDR